MTEERQPHTLVLVLQDLEFGGTQRYAINLLQHIDRKMFRPELWVLRGGVDMGGLAERTGVKIKWFSKSGWVTPLALFRFFCHLYHCKPICLYSLTGVPNIWSRIFGRLLNVSSIITSCRSIQPKQWERLLWRLSTHIICNAEAVKEKLKCSYRVEARRITVIANGVDTDYFHPLPGKKATCPTLLFSGRLVPVKDPMTALKAFQVVLGTVPDARMIMTGNGELNRQLRRFIEEQCLEGSVSLLPGTLDIRDHMHESWVFFMSSLAEGSPNILIEAMACGLPVVATEVGGVPEIIKSGDNGYLVPPKNYELLAEAAIALLTDKKLRERAGSRARNAVLANHAIHKCVHLTEQVLFEQVKKAVGK